jgi:GNAT superfamily N-acetyltransferase
MTGHVIVPLAAEHVRDEFDCGQPTLDDFLRLHAGQYERRNLGRTFVAVEPAQTRVDGFYTLSTGGVAFEHLTEEIRRKLPRHPLPVVHLGRLAVDRRLHGRGMGRRLLLDALRRAYAIAQSVGVHAVEVVAIDDAARTFYLKYGFTSLLDDANHLYLPIKTIGKLWTP